MPDDRYRDLIHRQLTGSISAHEAKELSEWIARSKSNSSYYEACKTFYRAEQPDFHEAETHKHWLELKEKIERYESAKTSQSSSGFSNVYWKVAASFIIVALGTLLISRLYFDEELLRLENTSTAPVMHYLPDSSVVWLNQGSVISYSPGFEGSERKLTLIGEGFFEVKKDAQKPFVVYASDIEVKVIGTSFNVRSGKHLGNVQLTVLTGTVRFRELDDASGVVVSAGEAVAYDHMAKQILPVVKADPNVLSWKTNVLSFEKAKLADVVEALNAHYKTNISLEKAIASCRFTGSFRKLSMQEAVEILTLSLDLHAGTFNDSTFLTGPGCK